MGKASWISHHSGVVDNSTCAICIKHRKEMLSRKFKICDRWVLNVYLGNIDPIPASLIQI